MKPWLRPLLGVATACLVAACNVQSFVPNTAEPTALGHAAGQTLYAFSVLPKPQVAAYALPASGNASPLWVISGPKTQLRTARGELAVGADGTIYVLSGYESRLLVFSPGARGDAAPERIADLPKRGEFRGFGLDPYGNFWTSDYATGNLVRFPIGSAGAMRPSAHIVPELDTPDGFLKAYPVSVATLGAHVYCECVVLYHGAQAIGITQYRVAADGTARRVRSFYDFAGPPLPEVPPPMLHVDARTGEIYAGSTLSNFGVFIYSSHEKTGVLTKRSRTIWGPKTRIDQIDALTTDADDNLYVATPSAVRVFGPHAQGDVRPASGFADPAHLRYKVGSWGDFIVIR